VDTTFLELSGTTCPYDADDVIVGQSPIGTRWCGSLEGPSGSALAEGPSGPVRAQQGGTNTVLHLDCKNT
jgi:hypothetical protein